jgi:ABC-type transport system involved in multi-copper enzyme maturation permease subunit
MNQTGALQGALVFCGDVMREFFISGLRSGLRGRSFQAVFLLGFALIAVAYLAGNFSPRQPHTIALDVGLSGIRFTLILLSLFWIQELIAREIDRKTVLFSLSYPVSRAAFILGRYFAVLVLTGVALLILGLALMLAVVWAGGGYSQEYPVTLGAALWGTLLGLWVDVATVAALGACVAALSTVAVMPLAIGAAFAIAGKALGPTFDYLVSGADGDQALTGIFSPLIHVIRWVVPDLSRLDWRDWPMYGLVPDVAAIGWALLMAIAYASLCLTLAVWTFERREFS